jgi:FkbM family methyltransferase
METAFKKLIGAIAGSLGYEIRRRRPANSQARSKVWRGSLQGILAQLASTGWDPVTLFDVGAAFGDFSRSCSALFPGAHYVLIEPLKEFVPAIEAVASTIERSTYVPAAAGGQEGSLPIYVHADLWGSSTYRETEGVHVDGVERTVSVRTLDSLCREHRLPGPYLIKVDVQGAELDVIAGARQALGQTEVLILETSLFRSYVGGPQFCDVVVQMKDLGFVVYDIFGAMYRPLDGALAQVDLVLVKEEGRFRRQHIYATPEQRAAYNAASATCLQQKESTFV